MQSRFALPVVILSVLGAIAFSALWLREQQQVHELTIATGGAQGEYYAFAQALAAVVAQHEPQIHIRVLETEGSRQNMQLLDQHQVDLAIVQSDTPVSAEARAIAFLFPEVFHLLARNESGIQSVNDLRGKRLALMPEGSGSYALFQQLAAHYDLNATNFQPINLTPSEANQALLDGQVDALFQVIALGNPAMANLLQTGQIHLVPIDQAAALQLSLPYLEATTIPKGTYAGDIPAPPADLNVVGVRAVLMVHAEVNDSVIAQITQTLFDYRNELVTRYPRAAAIRLPDAGQNLGLPVHPGAASYYNEDQPNFLVEYAEPIGLLLSVSILLMSGFWQFRVWLIERQKNRADMYNLEILDLLSQVEHSTDVNELESARNKLFEIFRKVVVDLDKDRISPESFQSFTFPWEVALTTIRHREVLLKNVDVPSHLPNASGDRNIQ